MKTHRALREGPGRPRSRLAAASVAAAMAMCACSDEGRPAPDDVPMPPAPQLQAAAGGQAPLPAAFTQGHGTVPATGETPASPSSDGSLRLLGILKLGFGDVGLMAYLAYGGQAAQFYRPGDRLPDGSQLREVWPEAVVVVDVSQGRRRIELGQARADAEPSAAAFVAAEGQAGAAPSASTSQAPLKAADLPATGVEAEHYRPD